MAKTRILVVARDTELRAAVARALIGAGYGVEVAENLRRAQEAAADGDIALAIVAPDGLGSADASGELATEVEHIVTIAASSGGIDEADLLARVGVALRPVAVDDTKGGAEPSRPENLTLRFEGYTLDAGGRTCVDAAGQPVALTRAEFALLLTLARSAGKVLTRDELSQAASGRPAEPDDRTVDVLISRLRRKIEADAKSPRLIVTLPGEGYKLAARTQVVEPEAATSGAPQVRRENPVSAPAAVAPATTPGQRATITRYRTIAVTTAVAALACGAAILIAPWKNPAAPARTFQATAIPLVDDRARAQLAGYPRERGAKAIAISREAWGLSTGAVDDEAAKAEALARCHERDAAGFCRLYAVGDAVVWDSATLALPLAADVRADAPPAPAVTPEGLAKAWQAIWRTSPPPFATSYLRAPGHRALAVSLSRGYRSVNLANAAEAIRVAVERCSDVAQAPCLLVSVDGAWTVQLPQSYRIVAPFTLAGEADMSEAERQRIAAIYVDKDWRALAKGRSARWYAVAGRETELAAADAALKACAAEEPECRIHAIGNWRVGERLEVRQD